MSDFPVMSDYELPWPYHQRKNVTSWRDSVAWADKVMAEAREVVEESLAARLKARR